MTINKASNYSLKQPYASKNLHRVNEGKGIWWPSSLHSKGYCIQSTGNSFRQKMDFHRTRCAYIFLSVIN